MGKERQERTAATFRTRPSARLVRAAFAAAVAFSMVGCETKTEPVAEGKSSASAAQVEVAIEGFDMASLTPRERREFSAQVTELLAPCPETPVNIAQCVSEKRACKQCLPAAQVLLRQVQAGMSKKEREEAFHARFDAGKVKTIATDGSPEIGPADAVVTIVEWADFECPACRALGPVLEKVQRRFPDQVRFVYKFYPLPSHPHGEIAARAAISAMGQGKFWEMHHLLFENQDKLEMTDLEGYASRLNLDLPKFRAGMAAKETTERIEKDRKQAEDLGFSGTPFFFVGGRNVESRFLGADAYEDLAAWAKLDIELAGKTPAGAPSGSPSASPSAIPSAAPEAPSAVPAASSSASPGKK